MHLEKLTTGFYKLSLQERKQLLNEMGFISSEEIYLLNKEGTLDFHLADQFIENAIGCFSLPLGIALHFVIDGAEFMIPMAVEENSIIAAASKTAKWVKQQGEIITQTLGWLGIGQVQFPRVKSCNQVKAMIELHKKALIEKANQEVSQRMMLRGGGVKDITVREIKRPDGEWMAIIHLMIDTCDSMGANLINQICEYLKSPLEELLEERAGLCILSNLADSKVVQANVVIRDIDQALGEAIAEASLFARLDPYRAATNNKGVMNAIDAVVIATGNDWRAVEAGMHAYAAQNGQYTSITRWDMHDGHLYGEIKTPLAVGIVGGVTRMHPLAQLSLKILNVKSAEELARIIAAVGLVQNLAALTALVTDGINKGHMKLHIANLAIAVGATEEELPLLKKQLIEHFETHKQISESDAKEWLIKLRNDNHAV